MAIFSLRRAIFHFAALLTDIHMMVIFVVGAESCYAITWVPVTRQRILVTERTLQEVKPSIFVTLVSHAKLRP